MSSYCHSTLQRSVAVSGGNCCVVGETWKSSDYDSIEILTTNVGAEKLEFAIIDDAAAICSQAPRTDCVIAGHLER